VTRIACIVEGHGDKEALPIIVRRIAAQISPSTQVVIAPNEIIRVHRNQVVKDGELERHVELAARRLGGRGAILVLLDADGECPAALGPALLRRAKTKRSDLAISVVVAKEEFENWFVAAAGSLAGAGLIREGASVPSKPEDVRGKGWIERHLLGQQPYSEPLHQPALARAFDIEQARMNSPSFDKLWRDVVALLGGAAAAARPT